MKNTESTISVAALEYAKHNNIEHASLARVRDTAVKQFQELPWPTQADEEWRRTMIDPTSIEKFCTMSPQGTAASVPATNQEQLTIYSGLKEIQAMPAERLNLLCKLLHQRIIAADNRFILWPYLFLSDLIVIDFKRKCTSNDPITLTTTVHGDNQFAAPLVCLLTEQESEVWLLHTIKSTDDSEHLCVCDSITQVGDNSRVRIAYTYELNINSYQFSNGWATLGRDAHFRHGVVSIGGLLAKMRYDAYLNHPGSEAYLDGVYFGHEDQHHDLRTLQVHDAPSTNSFALYRGVILDEAHTVYQGLIKVTEQATGTDAYLTNNNLLLSDEARSDSIPSLNINTDEVKCSHGSTTGKIDPLQLFYLQSRGLSYHEARALLVGGFVDEVLRHFPEETREQVNNVISERIAELAH